MALIISGNLSGTQAATSAKGGDGLPQMAVGDVLQGRVSQLKDNGQGTFRFPDGRGFTFVGAKGLTEGEQVRLQVVRLVPEIALRLAGGESQVAGKLAGDIQQSLIRAPDLFSSLLEMVSARGGALLSRSGQSLLLPGQAGGSLVDAKGDSLAGILGKNLSNVSAEALLKGDLSGLARMLDGASRSEVARAVAALKEAAETLRSTGGGRGGESPELAAARNALSRVGDLVAMQDVLPRAAASADGSALLGYRVFWLNEGGLGEAIWRREGKRKKGGGAGEEGVTSVLLSLNLTNLGTIQARITLGDGLLGIHLAAEEESAIAALRGDVGTLRQAIQSHGLPLSQLDLTRLGGPAMRALRQEALGAPGSGGFDAQG